MIIMNIYNLHKIELSIRIVVLERAEGDGALQIKIEIDNAKTETEIVIVTARKDKTIMELIDLLQNFDKKMHEIIAYKEEKAYLIDINNILRIYGGNQKVYIQTEDNEYIVKYRLYQLEEFLDISSFIRISNSEIINIRKISGIDFGVTGKICICFPGGIKTFVSRRYIPKIKKKLGI